MLNLREQLEIAERILNAKVTSLRQLADISSYDSFSFYRSADLSGLDLSGQDLSGMNFEGADFRDSNLSRINYSLGAFNGSAIDSRYSFLRDDFDCYISDASSKNVDNGLYLFCAFRRDSIVELIDFLSLYHTSLAQLSGVGASTVRKVCTESVVSVETAARVSRALVKLLDENSRDQIPPAFRQPMIKFLSVRPEGGFQHISRRALIEIIELATRVQAAREKHGIASYPWRMHPNTLTWMENWYIKGRGPYPAEDVEQFGPGPLFENL